MDRDSFFNNLENQYQNKLPFVVYSRPIDSVIKCWLQNDDELRTTSDFSESGFVFSPFDLEKQSILFLEKFCKHHILETNYLEVEENTTESTISNLNENEHVQLVSKGIKTIQKGNLEKVVLLSLIHI